MNSLDTLLEEFEKKYVVQNAISVVIPMYGANCGDAEEIRKLITQAYTLGQTNALEAAEKIVREHLLTDWSGEEEVQAQINQIADKISSLKPNH